eukprot:14102740-Alexandrium_andersonii.AAC.1
MSRADPESAHESGPRGGPRWRKRAVASSIPQSSNPQSAQSLALGTREPSFYIMPGKHNLRKRG